MMLIVKQKSDGPQQNHNGDMSRKTRVDFPTLNTANCNKSVTPTIEEFN